MRVHSSSIVCNPKGITVLALLLGLAPVWWLLGFDFIAYPIAGILAVLAFPAKETVNGRPFLTPIERCLAGLVLLFVIRSLIAGIEGAPPGRIIAAAYNTLLLAMGLAIMRYARIYWDTRYTTTPLPRRFHLRQAFASTLVFSGIMCAVGFAIANTTDDIVVRWPTLLGLLTPPADNLIRFSQAATVSGGDWAYSDLYSQRFSILGPDSGASAALFAFACPFLLTAIPAHLKRKRALVLAGVVALLALTYTRTIMAGFILGTILATLAYAPWSRKVALIILALVGAILVLTLDPDRLTDITAYRQNSNSLRFITYQIAIEEVLAQNPFFGLGIKPRDDALYGIPTGSHSTFVSFFTKGGFAALTLLVVGLYVIPAAQWLKTTRLIRAMPGNSAVRQEAYQFLRAQCVIWLWLLFQDCDAPALAAFCLFLTIAYIQHFHRKCAAIARASKTSSAAAPPAADASKGMR